MKPRLSLLLAASLLLVACADQASAPADEDAAKQAADAQETRSLLDRLLGSADAMSDIEVLELIVGRQADENGMVDQAEDVFGKQDALFASAIVQGAAAGTALRAEWRRGDGQVISLSEQTVSAEGPLLARFALKSESTWEPGDYRLVLLSGEAELAAHEFRIE